MLKVFRVLQVLQVDLDRQDPQVLKVHRGFKVLKVFRVLLVRIQA